MKSVFLASVLLFSLVPGSLGQPTRQATEKTTAGVARSAPCISDWTKQRYDASFSEAEQSSLASFLTRLADNAEVNPRTCDFDFTALDRIRMASFVTNERDDFETFQNFVRSLESEITASGFSSSDFMKSLIHYAQLWRTPSGLLIVESAKKDTRVDVDANFCGFTSVMIRLRPGVHRLHVSRSNRAVLEEEVTIEDGKTLRRTAR